MSSDAVSNGAVRDVEALRRLPRALLWVIAARLKTLTLSITPVVAGTLYAAQRGVWRQDVAIAAALAAIAIQIGTNLWNDAADAARGVDTAERLGPPRVTALGLLDGRTVRRGAVASFATASFLGLYLAWTGGLPIIAIGVLSLLFGYLYSMGPMPLSMTPFGEGLVILFFGVAAVAGTAFLHMGHFEAHAVSLGLVFGLPAAAVLLLNNHRDRLSDKRAGRRTLAILLGPSASRVLFGLLLGAAALGMAVWLSRTCAPSVWATAPAMAAAAWLSVRMARLPVSTQLNHMLAKTALFQVVLVAAMAASSLVCGN